MQAVGLHISLIHVLVKHTDCKVSVVECSSFGDELFPMLTGRTAVDLHNSIIFNVFTATNPPQFFHIIVTHSCVFLWPTFTYLWPSVDNRVWSLLVRLVTSATFPVPFFMKFLYAGESSLLSSVIRYSYWRNMKTIPANLVSSSRPKEVSLLTLSLPRKFLKLSVTAEFFRVFLRNWEQSINQQKSTS